MRWMRETRRGAAFALLLFVGFAASAQKIPAPVGYVNDFADVISDRDEARIARISAAVKRSTGAEIVVATVSSLGDFPTVEALSLGMAEQWGVGEKGKDNGVLLVLAVAERRARIEVGYGLEGALPDGKVGRIMDTSMIPYFRNDDFGTGFVKAVEGIAGVIAKEYGVQIEDVSSAESDKYETTRGASSRSLVPLIIFLIIFFTGGGRFFLPLILLGGMGHGRYTRGGFGSSSRGGFGGGGFGGFGGGGFGGGGASRGF